MCYKGYFEYPCKGPDGAGCPYGYVRETVPVEHSPPCKEFVRTHKICAGGFVKKLVKSCTVMCTKCTADNFNQRYPRS